MHLPVQQSVPVMYQIVVSNTDMKTAALKRWAGWKQYKAHHPNASQKIISRLEGQARCEYEG